MCRETVFILFVVLNLVALCVTRREGVFRTVLEEVNTALDHRPTQLSVPSFMEELYNLLQTSGNDVFGYSRDNLDSEGPALKSFRASRVRDNNKRFKFHIPETTNLQNIAGALLLVRSGQDSVVTRFRRRPLNISEVSLSEEYLTFNATDSVKMFNHSHFYMEFYISAGDVQSEDVYLVVLEELLLETLQHVRRKRDTLMTSGRGFTTGVSTPEAEGCSLRSVTLNFDHVGWFWIIHPPTLEIGMCSGTCNTHDNNINITNNAFLRGLYSLEENSRIASPPACVPIGFSPANVMYFTLEYNVYVRHVPEAIAVSCGCR